MNAGESRWKGVMNAGDRDERVCECRGIGMERVSKCRDGRNGNRLNEYMR